MGVRVRVRASVRARARARVRVRVWRQLVPELLYTHDPSTFAAYLSPHGGYSQGRNGWRAEP